MAGTGHWAQGLGSSPRAASNNEMRIGQGRLHVLGYRRRNGMALVATGINDADTLHALGRFRTRNGINAGGNLLVNTTTWDRLVNNRPRAAIPEQAPPAGPTLPSPPPSHSGSPGAPPAPPPNTGPTSNKNNSVAAAKQTQARCDEGGILRFIVDSVSRIIVGQTQWIAGLIYGFAEAAVRTVAAIVNLGQTIRNIVDAVRNWRSTLNALWDWLNQQLEYVTTGNMFQVGRTVGGIVFNIVMVKATAAALSHLTTAVRNSSWFKRVANSAVGQAVSIPVIKVRDLARNVRESFHRYRQNGWRGNIQGQTPGTKAGGTFQNRDGLLPTRDASGRTITYREFDVNNRIAGMSRDAQRFVVGSDGSVFFTADHYRSFVRIID